MRVFQDLSLKHKLMLVLTMTSILVLAAAFLAFFLFERVSSESAMVRDLGTLSEVVAANSTAAVAFDAPQSASEVLATLRVRPSVASAWLFTADGRPFASYHRDSPGAAPPAQAPPDGTRLLGGRVVLVRGVHHGGERIGTVAITADMTELDTRLRRYGAAVILLMLGGGAASLLLALKVQALISRPILQLADAAKTVSQDKDYAVRVPHEGHDEIGGLTEAFNGMLTQIQARDGALQIAQQELEARVQDLLQEVAERKQAQAALRHSEEQLRHQAFHDALTDLPNRVLLNDRLANALAQAHRHHGHLAVLFLDLDRFKLINDSLGHSVGDQLLQRAALRLQKTLREADTLARLGGDEFVVLLPGIATDADAAKVARKILQCLHHPFHIDGHELFVSASVGISLYPGDGTNAETLVKNADVAMYRAKEQGRDNYQLYKTELHTRALKRMTLETQLRAAVARNEFRLFYQPIVDLETGSIVGSEALLRWQHPERGLVQPSEFIPVAEETGLIHALGSWVMRTGCTEAQSWEGRGLPPICVAINLSALQFQQEDLVSQVAAILDETGLEPRRLDLEITETAAMENADHTVATLNGMKRLGVRLTMDDFGTGYSSLSSLRRFPLHALKIDRSFIQDITSDPRDAAVAQAIIALGHGLEIDVIAEGVETEAQRLVLSSHGCQKLQGFLFSEPLTGEAFGALLARNHNLPLAAVDTGRRLTAN